MAAVRLKAGIMSTKLSKKTTPQQIQASDSSDDDDMRDTDSEVSEAENEEGSVGDSNDESQEEESADGEEASDAEMVESENEEEDSDDDEDDTSEDELDDDDDADGDTWMDVEEDENSDEGSSSSDDDGSSTNGKSKLHVNEGWADAMAKILRTSKPKGKKDIVLAKAKKLSQISSENPEVSKEDYGFEIDENQEDEEVKPNIDELDVKPPIEELDTKPKVEEIIQPIRRRDRLAEGKVKPSVLDRERERALSKIATKGVVQLFNAVRQQQKTLSGKIKEAKGSIVKEDQVLKSIDKRAFLDVLMGAAPSEKVENYVPQKTGKEIVKKEEPGTWSVLRDNFLTGSNLKDWDKCGEIKIENDDDEVMLN